MYKAEDIALYLLSLDKEKNIFNENLLKKNGRKFYEGNLILNKLMHLSANIFLAKNNKLLIEEYFLAYDNGPVIKNIQKNYRELIRKNNEQSNLPKDIKIFLDKVYSIFKDATVEELIQISHKDPAWKEKIGEKDESKQRMFTINHRSEYCEQFEDIIYCLDNEDMSNKTSNKIEINNVVFYYDDDFNLTDEVKKELEEFSLVADDNIYSVYSDEVGLVIY